MNLLLTAGDIMTRDVTTITAESSIPVAIRLIVDRRVSGLPVLGGAGVVVGILTEGDVLRRVELETDAHRLGWLNSALASDAGPRITSRRIAVLSPT